jgi:phosphomannomutase
MVTEQHGGVYHASAVGEVHVVEKMKAVGAVIGGEGNGGIIYPRLHYGRDALVGAALFLSALEESGGTATQLRARYPTDVIAKKKKQLTDASPEVALERVRKAFAGHPMDETDGIRIALGDDWVHVRQSNTEPIVRVYAESHTLAEAEALAQRILDVI